jgi:hypothetical protein
MITPSQLARAIEEIIAEECGCTASWIQHPEPVSLSELSRIAGRIERLLDVEFEKRRLQP